MTQTYSVVASSAVVNSQPRLARLSLYSRFILVVCVIVIFGVVLTNTVAAVAGKFTITLTSYFFRTLFSAHKVKDRVVHCSVDRGGMEPSTPSAD